MFIKIKKAQSTLEYAILIAVIVAGLVTMQVFMKRSYQGRLRSSTDQIGEQFSPEDSTYEYTTKYTSNTEELTNTADALKGSKSKLLTPEEQKRWGWEETPELNDNQ